jgi:hypothetical protein
MLPTQNIVVDPQTGSAMPDFAAGSHSAFADSEFSAAARFQVTTDEHEFYGPPELVCAPPVPACAHIEVVEGGVGQQGNVDPDLVAQFFEGGSALELVVAYDCADEAAATEATLNVTFTMLQAPYNTLAEMERLQADVDAGEPFPAFRPVGRTVTFSWRRRCPAPGTVHRGFSATLGEERQDAATAAGAVVVVGAGLVAPAFAVANPTHVVPAEATSTEFRIGATVGSFAWEKPVVVSSSASVAVKATGTAAAPGATYSGADVDDATLVLLYERCDAPARAVITVRWTLPPYRAVEFAFAKECGGGDAPGFTVAVQTPQGTQLAVNNGRTAPDWTTASTVFGAGTDTAMMWLSAASKPVIVLRVTLSQNPSVLFRSALTGELANIPQGGFTLRDKESPLLLGFKCEKAGQTRVTVSFQVEKYRAVDVSFVKQCKAPAPPKKEKPPGWSALSIVIVVTSGAFAIGTILACLRAEPKRRIRQRTQLPRDLDL